MKFLITVLAVSAVWAGDSSSSKSGSLASGSVTDWTNDLLNSVRNERFDDITKYFTADTTLEFKSNELPFGGEFKGEDIRVFFKKRDLAATFSSLTYTLRAVDEAMGNALVECSGHVVFRRSGGQVDVRGGAWIQWNVVTGKIIKICIAELNETEVLNAYYTRAERLYWNMVNSVWKRESVSLNLDDSIWNYIADDITIKIHMHPQGFYSKTEYHGKAEALDFMLELKSKILKGMSHHRRLFELLIRRGFEHHILFSDDNMVVIHFKFGQFEGIKKLTFNGAGQVTLCENLLFPLYPWQLYKPPVFLGGDSSDTTSSGKVGDMNVQIPAQTPMIKPVLAPIETIAVKQPIMTEAPVQPVQKGKTLPIESAPLPVKEEQPVKQQETEPIKQTEAPQPVQQGKDKTLAIETQAPVMQTEAPQPVQQGKDKTLAIETQEPVKQTEAPQPVQQGKGKTLAIEQPIETSKPVEPVQNTQLSSGKKGTR